MDNFIELKGVGKVYGHFTSEFKALNDVNIKVKSGEFLGIMGPSGSGKSTLANIISTLDAPTSGTILINGKILNKLNNEELSNFRRNNIGFIFQSYNLLDTLTNRDNIIAPLILANSWNLKSEQRVKDISEKLDLDRYLDKFPSECSGGQRQRVAIARAIITNPKLVVADEPTESLDIEKSIEVATILKELNMEFKMTVIMITHDQLIGSFCDRIVKVKDGEINGFIERDYKGGEAQTSFYKRIIDETAIDVAEAISRI